MSRLHNRVLAWQSFPLHIHFIHDENYSERREACALAGFNRWVDATDGFVDYDVTENRARAQITVRFNPRTANGVTEQHYGRGRMRGADITIGVREGVSRDMEAVSAHEFGHALGISGHSDDEHDLMYPVHFAGTGCHLTERDLNTLASGYPALAKRLAAREDSLAP